MAKIINNTARQYNLKGMSGNQKVSVRLMPGNNDVPDKDWKIAKSTEFAKGLIDDNSVEVAKASVGRPKKKELELEKVEPSEEKDQLASDVAS